MNWQEKYYEIALKAVKSGCMIQKQVQNNGDPTPSIYDSTDIPNLTKKEAHKIADELDRLHDMDMDIIYRKKPKKNVPEKNIPF